MVRPVRAFEGILNAVVAELQRSKGAKVTLTLEIEANVEDGFSEADIGVVRDNARQLKFKTKFHRVRVTASRHFAAEAYPALTRTKSVRAFFH